MHSNGIIAGTYSEKKRENILLFTGRIIPDKNPDVLIKAVSILEQKYINYKILFIGPIEEEYKVELINLAKSCGLNNELSFIGPFNASDEHEKEILMDYYSKAKIFISLGSWEGQPTRLMEAMQFKTPVIAYASGGTEDLIIDQINGLIINKLDHILLKNKIEMLLSNEELAKKLGDAAQKAIIKDYNWNDSFEKIYTLYRKLIKNKADLP